MNQQNTIANDEKIVEYRLTTFDNPWNPFENFDEWFLYDVGKGYNTCGKIARLSVNDNSLTPKEELQAQEKVIDRIIELDFMNIYKKVPRP